MGFEDQEDFSAPLSPNHVREGHSQDMPAEGSVFNVSPDLPGYNMRPAGVGLKSSDIIQPPPSVHGGLKDSFFGAPIAFAQCNKIPGSDTPMTLPIYSMPKEANIFPNQSAVPTVLASGVTPDSIPWSSAEDMIRDISREGPFDASASPMDTEDIPLISTGLPGCPYRIYVLHGDSTVGCERDIWVATPSPPVLGIHWSAGVSTIIEPLTVVLGGPPGRRKCHGGGCQPAARCRPHDVESSNTGTIRDGVTSDVI